MLSGPRADGDSSKVPSRHMHTHAAVLSLPEQLKLNTETLPWSEEELTASSEPNKHFLTMGKYNEVNI